MELMAKIQKPDEKMDEIVGLIQQLKTKAADANAGMVIVRDALNEIEDTLVKLRNSPIGENEKLDVETKLARVGRIQELRCTMEVGWFEQSCRRLASEIYKKL